MSEREAGDGGDSVCVHVTERTTHHWHFFNLHVFEYLTKAIDNIHFLTLVEL